jgi:hypothetical protein
VPTSTNVSTRWHCPSLKSARRRWVQGGAGAGCTGFSLVLWAFHAPASVETLHCNTLVLTSNLRTMYHHCPIPHKTHTQADWDEGLIQSGLKEAARNSQGLEDSNQLTVGLHSGERQPDAAISLPAAAAASSWNAPAAVLARSLSAQARREATARIQGSQGSGLLLLRSRSQGVSPAGPGFIVVGRAATAVDDGPAPPPAWSVVQTNSPTTTGTGTAGAARRLRRQRVAGSSAFRGSQASLVPV